TGLLRRDDEGKLLVRDRASGGFVAFDQKGVRPDLSGGDTVMAAIAERYLSDAYAPEAVAERCGLDPKQIRGLAAQMADAAFNQAFELQKPWTDFRGERHATMTGRPLSMHAMRGISAHANGFQTARALHLLQILLGTVEVPGGFRFKPPYPKPPEAHPKPHSRVTPDTPLDGPHLGFVQGPEDLALKADGSPARIDKAFTWENPMSAHGLMHMVISNAHAGDPYDIDTLFLYMANMSWNSSMNTGGVMDMLTDTRDDGSYKIPHLIYADAYSSEMVAYADLVLPDTTYLERHDCISLLDRPICEADAAADAIRWPVVEPDRDVRGFQTVLIDLATRLKLPGFVTDTGDAKYSDYAHYMVTHERKPGIGPLGGWREADGRESPSAHADVSPAQPPADNAALAGGRAGDAEGESRPAPAGARGSAPADQLDRYIENGGFWMAHIPEEALYYKPWNQRYQNWAVSMGFYDAPQPYLFNLYCEPLRRFQMAAEGHGALQPPDHLRPRIKEQLDPLPLWWDSTATSEQYPVHALTQRPMAMYHSWGTQNAWLRQIHGQNPMYLPTRLWEAHGFRTGDWARIS
ncbi:MAG: formate dehydrogenase, partial [Pseudomonadota bacterium]